MSVKIENKWGDAEKALEKRYKRAVGMVCEDWLAEAKSILKDHQSQVGGGMIQQFGQRVRGGLRTKIRGTVFNDAQHAAVIHQGWASEKENPKMPPTDILAKWVSQQTKLNIQDEDEAQGIAFAIAKRMKAEKQFLSEDLRRRPEAPKGGARFFQLPAKKKSKKWARFIEEEARKK